MYGHGGFRRSAPRGFSMMRLLLAVALALLLALAAAAGYFLHAPAPAPDGLAGALHHETIEAGGRTRHYALYLPPRLAPDAPLLIVLHGSMGSGEQIRVQSGYGFDRLADRHGFAVAYPDGYERHWNDCRRAGPYAAKQQNVDDVGFVEALAARLAQAHGIGRQRRFAVGYSNGGHMAFRLALGRPGSVAGIAAIGATLPADDNLVCALHPRLPPVMLVHGTRDPLNPYAGGETTLFGFASRGNVRSARDSAQVFAHLLALAPAPRVERRPLEHGLALERLDWHGADGLVRVRLDVLHGAGHTIPQPAYRFPRLLGPTARDFDGPAAVWGFFAALPPG